MLCAYKIQNIIVFAHKGTEAKLMAAPLLKPNDYWRNNVAEWVRLRAERDASLDHLCDTSRTSAYVHSS